MFIFHFYILFLLFMLSMFIAVKICLKWRNIILHPLYVDSKKKWFKWTYLQNRKRLTDLENELMVAQGEEIVKEFGSFRDTLIYSKWITNKDLLYSTWNSTQSHMTAWMGEGFGGQWVHVYVCLSPCVCVFSVASNCLQPHGLSSSRVLCPWNFPGKNIGVSCHAIL